MPLSKAMVACKERVLTSQATQTAIRHDASTRATEVTLREDEKVLSNSGALSINSHAH